MILHIPEDLLAGIEAHAKESHPEECCGALVGPVPEDFGQGSAELRVTQVRRLDNAWEGPARGTRYQVGPEAVAALEKEFAGGPDGILGFYHSHPDLPAWPSPFDLQRAWPSYAYLILQAHKDKVAQRRVWLLSYDTRSFEEHKLKVAPAAVAPKR